MTQNIASLNAVYLGISVGIILTLGTAFYFFNFKPLQEKIARQEEELKSEKKDNENKLKQLTTDVKETQKNAIEKVTQLREELTKVLNSKIVNAEKRIGELEALAKREIAAMKHNANVIELTNIWDKQYLWSLGGLEVPENALRNLIEYLNKSVKYGVHIASLDTCFGAVEDILNKIKKERSLSFSDKKGRKELHDKLVEALSKTNGESTKITELIKKAEKTLVDNA